MSSYLTGWQSDEKPCIQDLYNLEVKHKVNKQEKPKYTRLSRIIKAKSQIKGKYVLPIKKFISIREKQPQQKKFSVLIMNPPVKKPKQNISSEKLTKKFYGNKQNVFKEFCQKSTEIRNKFIKINSDVKFSVVNVFEKLDLKKPEQSLYRYASRKKQFSLSKPKSHFFKSSQFRPKQFKHNSITIEAIKNKTTMNVAELQYENMLSYQSTHQKNTLLPLVKKIQKSVTDYFSKTLSKNIRLAKAMR